MWLSVVHHLNICLHVTNRICATDSEARTMNGNKKLEIDYYFTALLHVLLSLRIIQVATQFSAYANRDDVIIITSNYAT